MNIKMSSGWAGRVVFGIDFMFQLLNDWRLIRRERWEKVELNVALAKMPLCWSENWNNWEISRRIDVGAESGISEWGNRASEWPNQIWRKDEGQGNFFFAIQRCGLWALRVTCEGKAQASCYVLRARICETASLGWVLETMTSRQHKCFFSHNRGGTW